MWSIVARYKDENMPPIKRLEIYNKILDLKSLSGKGGRSRTAATASSSGDALPDKSPEKPSTGGECEKLPALQQQQRQQHPQSRQQRRNIQPQQDEDSAHSSSNSLDTSSE